MQRWLLVLVATIVTCTVAMAVTARLYAQSPLPPFILHADTSISVTIALADGQRVTVPIDLRFVTRSESEGVYMALEANAAQPDNATAEVQASGHISASVQAMAARPTNTPIAVAPPTSTPAPTATVTIARTTPTVAPTMPPGAPADNTHRIGDNVTTGNIKWRILAADDLGNRLVSDNQFVDDATTGGRFIRVTLEVDNRGNEPASYWEPEMLDSQGREFNDYSGQYYFIPDEQECLFLVLNPGISKRCVHIYEVAGDAQGLRLKVTDFGLFWGNEAIIELH